MERKEQRSLDEWSLPFRHSLLKGIGYTTEQLERPLIGVLNSWGEINPGATHLDRLTKMVPNVLNITLDQAMKMEPGMAEAGRKDPRVAEVLQTARRLE